MSIFLANICRHKSITTAIIVSITGNYIFPITSQHLFIVIQFPHHYSLLSPATIHYRVKPQFTAELSAILTRLDASSSSMMPMSRPWAMARRLPCTKLPTITLAGPTSVPTHAPTHIATGNKTHAPTHIAVDTHQRT